MALGSNLYQKCQQTLYSQNTNQRSLTKLLPLPNLDAQKSQAAINGFSNINSTA
jgi:hypothetical protein